MPLKIKYTEQKAVPEGYYVARLDGLEPVTNQFGDSVKWTFTIQAPQEFVGTQVTGMSSTKVSPKSKMFAWLQAFGVVLNPDEEFDIETLLGKMCQIRTVNKTKTTVKDGHEQTTTFSNVDAVAAYIPPASVQSTAQTNMESQQQVTPAVNPPQQQATSTVNPSQSQTTPTVNPSQPQTTPAVNPSQPQTTPTVNPSQQNLQPQQPSQQNNVVPPDQVNPDENFDF